MQGHLEAMQRLVPGAVRATRLRPQRKMASRELRQHAEPHRALWAFERLAQSRQRSRPMHGELRAAAQLLMQCDQIHRRLRLRLVLQECGLEKVEHLCREDSVLLRSVVRVPVHSSRRSHRLAPQPLPPLLHLLHEIESFGDAPIDLHVA